MSKEIFEQNQFNNEDKKFFIIFFGTPIVIITGGLIYFLVFSITNSGEYAIDYLGFIISILSILLILFLFFSFLLFIFKEYKVNIYGNKIEFRRFPVYFNKKNYKLNEILSFTKDYVSYTNPTPSRVRGGYIYHFFTKDGRKYKVNTRTEEADKIDLALRGKS